MSCVLVLCTSWSQARPPAPHLLQHLLCSWALLSSSYPPAGSGDGHCWHSLVAGDKLQRPIGLANCLPLGCLRLDLVLGSAVAALCSPCVPILHGRVLPTGVGLAAQFHPCFFGGQQLYLFLVQLGPSSTQCTTGWFCCGVGTTFLSRERLCTVLIRGCGARGCWVNHSHVGPGWALAGLEVWGAAAMLAPGQVAWWLGHSVYSKIRWIRRRLTNPTLCQPGA